MRLRSALATLALSALAATAAPASAGSGQAAEAPWSPERMTREDWDARAAEHLVNRAGFGASGLEVERLVAVGPEAAVAGLFVPQRHVDPYFLELDESYRDVRNRAREMMEEGTMTVEEIRESLRDEMRRVRASYRQRDRRQMSTYSSWWVDRMVDGDDPLRDRMTLFWSGLFTSSYREVKNSRAMIEQHQLLREGALGSYADLLRGIARDPAMLEYLDASSNKKRSPNENFARELLELFSLGEGHYAEADIIAAARAFTGWTNRRGETMFNRRQHDGGEKTFMGVTGRLNGDDVIEIVLDQERCAEYVAERLLEYFEGRAPAAERTEYYAGVLHASDYEVRPFLEELFLDRAFYADDVVGQRIASPVDLLVGQVRRLGVAPPTGLLAAGASSVGQTLFAPPSVKGWDEGRAWITTTTIMQRGNLSGVLVGTVGSQEFLDTGDLEAELDEPMMDSDGPALGEGRRRSDDIVRLLGRIEDFGWQPTLNLSARARRLGASDDAAVVDLLAQELLAVELSERSRAELIAFVREERAATSLPADCWSSLGSDVEYLARRLAHLMLSMPEGQLH